MACNCNALKAEVASQRELMAEWFQTLMVEIRDAKAELVQLIKANTFNVIEQLKTTQQPLTGQESSIAEPICASAFLESINSPLQYIDAVSDSNPVSLSLEPIGNPEMEQTPEPTFETELLSPKLEPAAEEVSVEFSLTQNKHRDDGEPLDEQVKATSALNQFTSVGSETFSAIVKNEQIETGPAKKSCDYNDICSEKSDIDDKPFRCRLCQKKFKRNYHLTEHQQVHTGEKPFACNQCDYRTSRKYNLQNHQKCHTGQKPFHCHLCDFRAVSRSAVACHRKRKHQPQV